MAMDTSLVPCFLGLVAVFVGLNNFNAAAIHTEDGLELLFRQRSNSDWERVWHSETYTRCRDKLIPHLYWACEKDIYRLIRRNRKRTDGTFTKHNKSLSFLPFWL